MNEIDNDWIDDILDEDSPEYDDTTEDTLADTYTDSWIQSHSTHLPLYRLNYGRRVSVTFGDTITRVALRMVLSSLSSKQLTTHAHSQHNYDTINVTIC